MKRILTIALALLALVSEVRAQGPINGNLSAASTDCSVAGSCLQISIPQNGSAVSIQLSNTFSGTVQFEATVGPTWRAIQGTLITDGTQVTSATGVGIWIFPVSGLNALRLRASALASGTVTVDGRISSGSPLPLASSFSGSISGNAAAGTIGGSPPGSGDFNAVADVATGFLTGVTGNAIGGHEAANVDVLALPATIALPTLASTSTKQSDGSQKTQVVAGDGTVQAFTGTSANVNVTGGVSPGVAQNSTTSGQTITPAGCANTTVAPANTNAKTFMINCGPDGSLRISQETAALLNATVQPGNTANTTPWLVSTPYQFNCVDRSGSITTGGTAVTAAALNSARQNITLLNYPDATTQGVSVAENLFFSFTGTATETAGVPATGVGVLLPGQSFTFGPTVTVQALSVNAQSNGHKWYSCEQ